MAQETVAQAIKRLTCGYSEARTMAAWYESELHIDLITGNRCYKFCDGSILCAINGDIVVCQHVYVQRDANKILSATFTPHSEGV